VQYKWQIHASYLSMLSLLFCDFELISYVLASLFLKISPSPQDQMKPNSTSMSLCAAGAILTWDILNRLHIWLRKKCYGKCNLFSQWENHVPIMHNKFLNNFACTHSQLWTKIHEGRSRHPLTLTDWLSSWIALLQSSSTLAHSLINSIGT